MPDILDVIAQLSSDEVPTPPLLARAMLDLLPEDVWSNPHYRWLNPASKSGAILRETAKRLMAGLATWQPDPAKRAEHILRHMLFGCSITQLTGEMTRRSVYISRDATSRHAVLRFSTRDGNLPFVGAEHDYPLGKDGKVKGLCRICSAPSSLERGEHRENHAYAFIHGAYPTQEMQEMKFDVVVGNPPYQIGIENQRDSRDANPIYQYFVENAIALDPKYVAMIVPSRWFTGGKAQLDKFRANMIADRRLRAVVDNPKLFDCFPGVEIKGGVNYFLWDRDHDGGCEFSTRIDGTIISTVTRDLRAGEGVIVRDNSAASIIQKTVKLRKSIGTVEDRVAPRYPFGPSLMSNFSEAATQPYPGSIPLIFGGRVEYISEGQITRNRDWVDKWKVLIPKAGDGHGREISYVLGEPIAVAPGSACTQTYLVAGTFGSATEAENYAHYLTTKFARFLVLQRKATQDVTPDRFRFIPALDMSRRWSDEELYAHFNLTDTEIAHIESSIHPRNPILSLNSPIPETHLPGGRKYRPPGVRAEDDGEEN
ncbi:Eco57I restriction-modification methylase domain-containing protein [Arthrobacter rhombi]|uniref:Eco57I restriction-modification methylase domain-containing protein n=1 Tax=Arthrobacter rhombi TaxID=71253 RepID=UPI003FD1C686